jgi:hypothetical protein
MYASEVITGVGFDEAIPTGLEVSCVDHFASRHLCLFASQISPQQNLMYGSQDSPGAERFGGEFKLCIIITHKASAKVDGAGLWRLRLHASCCSSVLFVLSREEKSLRNRT